MTYQVIEGHFRDLKTRGVINLRIPIFRVVLFSFLCRTEPAPHEHVRVRIKRSFPERNGQQCGEEESRHDHAVEICICLLADEWPAGR